MVFRETRVFERLITEILSDEDYAQLQDELQTKPDRGDIIPGGKGLRKYRFALEGQGRRSGARVIYYWVVSQDLIYMVYAFRKNEKSDLTKKQLKVLAELIRSEFK